VVSATAVSLWRAGVQSRRRAQFLVFVQRRTLPWFCLVGEPYASTPGDLAGEDWNEFLGRRTCTCPMKPENGHTDGRGDPRRSSQGIQDVAEKVYKKGKKTLTKATETVLDGSPAESSARFGRDETMKEQAKSRAKDRVIDVPYIELSSENSFKVGKGQCGLDLWLVCKCLVKGILPKVRCPPQCCHGRHRT
jgi:hypothetical protein